MFDVSFDPASAIRVPGDAPAPSNAAAPNTSAAAPSFGDHLSRARQSGSARFDRAASAGDSERQPPADQTQGATNADAPASPSEASKKDGQDKAPETAKPAKKADSRKDSQGADHGADAPPAAAAAAQQQPAAPAEESGDKAQENAAAADATLQAAAALAAASAPSGAPTGVPPTPAQDAAEAAGQTDQPAPAQADQSNGAASQVQTPVVAPAALQAVAVVAPAPTKASTSPGSKPSESPISGTEPAQPNTSETSAAGVASAPASPLSTAATAKAALDATTPTPTETGKGGSAPAQPSDDAQDAAVAAAAGNAIAPVALSGVAVEHAAAETNSDSKSPAAVERPQAGAPQAAGPQSPPSALSQPQPHGNNPDAATELQGKPGLDFASGPVAADNDRLRFIQRVARAFQAATDNGGQVKLRLSPPDLGSLQLNITLKDGAMTAHIQAETPAAQDLLLSNLPDLRDRLAQQDVRIERFDVDLMDRSPGGMPQTPDQHQQNADDLNRRMAPVKNAPSGNSEVDGAGPSTSRTYQGGGLNVVI